MMSRRLKTTIVKHEGGQIYESYMAIHIFILEHFIFSLKCSQCTKEFVNHDKLEKHIRRKHIDDNNPRTILEDENKIHR